jgi:hypothetical protein
MVGHVKHLDAFLKGVAPEHITWVALTRIEDPHLNPGLIGKDTARPLCACKITAFGRLIEPDCPEHRDE